MEIKETKIEIEITIDGEKVNAYENDTVLNAARKNNIDIPTLCFDPDLPPHGNCRLCLCEIDGRIMSACNTIVTTGQNIQTKTEKIIKYRKLNLEILLARHDFHNKGPFYSILKRYLDEYDIKDTRFSKKEKISTPIKIDSSNHCLSFEKDLCILCGQCIEKCSVTQTVDALCYVNRGKNMEMTTAFNTKFIDSPCVACGLCTQVCPTRALRELDETKIVIAALKDPNKHVVFQLAPSVRVTIGEEFGLPYGTVVTKKLIKALKLMGADKVFDTNFGADLTIMEESAELLHRIRNNGVLPLITSCSPGWVNFIEKFYPNLLPHVSSCKSPQQMFGVITKTYYAKNANIDPANIFVVSIMPCIAKKNESKREDMFASGYQDVDLVLTAREAARLIKDHNLNLPNLDNADFDNPLGEATGAAQIFGATGGVLEAALRTGYEIATGKTLEKLDFNETRGLKGLKTASIALDKIKLNFAVAHGLSNAKILLDEINSGNENYHFIEVMACPGGCLGGGGQPIPTNNTVRQKRMQSIYQEDKKIVLRKSHENSVIKKLYAEFLGAPLGEMSHKLLHTHYTKKEFYV